MWKLTPFEFLWKHTHSCKKYTNMKNTNMWKLTHTEEKDIYEWKLRYMCWNWYTHVKTETYLWKLIHEWKWIYKIKTDTYIWKLTTFTFLWDHTHSCEKYTSMKNTNMWKLTHTEENDIYKWKLIYMCWKCIYMWKLIHI